MQDRRTAAKILNHVEHLAATAFDDVAATRVDIQIGAAESVDRLLGIADEKELGAYPHVFPARRRAAVFRQHHHQLGLQRVGVLKLVDAQHLDACAQLAAHREVLLQQRARLQQEILKIQDAEPVLLLRVGSEEASHPTDPGAQNTVRQLLPHQRQLSLDSQTACFVFVRGAMGPRTAPTRRRAHTQILNEDARPAGHGELLERIQAARQTLHVEQAFVFGIATKGLGMLAAAANLVPCRTHLGLQIARRRGQVEQGLDVAIFVQGKRQGLEVGFQLHARLQNRAQTLVFQRLIELGFDPPAPEGTLDLQGFEFVENAELRIDAGLGRPLAQQRGREGVDRRDAGAMQFLQGATQPCT